LAPPAHATARDDLPRALVWMLVSGLSFALMGAAVKLAGDLPVGVKVFFRNLVTLAITTTTALRNRANPLAPTPHLKLLLVRAFCGLGGVYFYFLALGDLNLADASLLNKTSPFFATLFAVALLGERPGRGAGGEPDPHPGLRRPPQPGAGRLRLGPHRRDGIRARAQR